MISRIAGAWNGYWFVESDKFNYGIFRIVFLTGMILFRSSLSAREASFPSVFSDAPILIRLLHLPFPPSPETLSTLLSAQSLLLAMGLVGVLTRPTLVLLSLVTLYVDSFGSSFGLFDHATSVPDLVLLTLALSPGVSTFSLDFLVRRLRGARETPWPRVPVWPMRLVLLLLALNYGAAGLSKIRFGSNWSSGDTLAFYLSPHDRSPSFSASGRVPEQDKWRDGFGLESFVFSSAPEENALARSIGDSKPLSRFLSIGSWIFELTFPVVLIWPRTMFLYFLGGAAFHLGVFLTFGLNFFLYMFTYALYIDWKRVWLSWLSSNRFFNSSRAS
jgi:hypothetical protein